MACACSLVSVAGPSTMNCFALPSWSVPPPDAAGVVVSSGGRGLPMAARPGRFLRCRSEFTLSHTPESVPVYVNFSSGVLAYRFASIVPACLRN